MALPTTADLPRADPGPGTRLQVVLDRAMLGVALTLLIAVPLAFTPLTPNAGSAKDVLIDAVAVIALILILTSATVTGRFAVVLPRSAAPLATFLAMAFASFLWSTSSSATAREVWRVGVACVLFALGVHMGRRGERVLLAARVVAATAGIVAAYGVMQGLGLDPLIWGGTTVVGRAASTLGHPNFLAAYLAFALPVTAGLFVSTRQRGAVVALGIDIALQASCMAFTYSRGGYIGGLAGAGTFMALVMLPRVREGARSTPRSRVAALGAILAISTLVSAFPSTGYNPFTSRAASLSLQTRVQIYKGSLAMFAGAPVIGHGAGTFNTVFPQFRPRAYPAVDPRPNVLHAHCEYLEIADELGLVGLGLFGWLLFTALVPSIRATRNEADDARRLLQAGLIAGVAGVLTHGAFCVVLRTPVPSAHLWLALGIMSVHGARAYERPVPRAAGAAATLIIGAAVLVLFQRMSVAPFVSMVNERWGSDIQEEGRWADAAAAYRTAIVRDPWNLEARYRRAACLVELDDYAGALAEYEGVAALSPDFVHLRYCMATMHVFRHEWHDALTELDRADATAAVPASFDTAAARDIMRSERPDDAKETDLFRMLVRSSFIEEERITGALRADVAQQMTAKGSAYYQRRQFARAEVLLEMALEKDPADRAALNNLAGIHFERKEYRKAIATCMRWLADHPDDAHVAMNAAKAHVFAGELDIAERMVRAVLSRDPDDADAKSVHRAIERRRPLPKR